MLTTTFELSEARWNAAPTFAQWLPTAQKNADLWRAVYDRARIPDDLAARARALGGPWHLLVLSEDWCGDAVNSVPVAQRLVERAPNLDLRLLGRDANPDVMDAHLTGTSRSIPVVMMLDERFRERGWWGPRPRELQEWVLGPGKAHPSDEKYREIRRWYARHHGREIVEEVVAMMEKGATTGT
ncbi:MAG: thioredoxin family protein [Gemmatimonadota bacterium]|nr:thioredoxin family protein [Gemmatimonadota bacterium]MDE3171500.1 thioredoxin family protein [Gemmatimonadota bacterium]